MIQSLVLFVHITGVLTMFAGLALEAFGVEPTGRATPRVFGLAVPLTLVSGLYMGARFGVLGDAWMRASYGAIVIMAAAGPLARRSDALRQLSLRARAAFGLAIVFLMVAKPDALVSLMVLGLVLGFSILVGLPIGRMASNCATSGPLGSTSAISPARVRCSTRSSRVYKRRGS